MAGLPEQARRFFLHAIESGAGLATVVEIRMQGELSLGTRQDPKYQPMVAQILAAPHGLVWRLRSGRGVMRVSGSDGTGPAPFRVEAGNFFGTPEYFPFYRARVLSVRMPGAAPGQC